MTEAMMVYAGKFMLRFISSIV